jgi:hypothetical protein
MNFKKILSLILIIGLITILSSSIVFACTPRLENGATFTTPPGYSLESNAGNSGVSLKCDDGNVKIYVSSDVSDDVKQSLNGFDYKSSSTVNINGTNVQIKDYTNSIGLIIHEYTFRKDNHDYQIFASADIDTQWNISNGNNPVNMIINTLKK